MELDKKTLNKAIDILYSEKEKQTIFSSICVDFEPELFTLSLKEKTQKTLNLFSFYEIKKMVYDFETYKKLKPFVFSKLEVADNTGVIPIMQSLIASKDSWVQDNPIGKCIQYLSNGILRWKIVFHFNENKFTLLDTFSFEKEAKEHLKKPHNFTTIVKRLNFLRYNPENQKNNSSHF